MYLESIPHLQQLEKAHAQKQRPSTAVNIKIVHKGSSFFTSLSMVVSFLFIVATSMGMSWISVVLICISLMTRDVVHLFVCFLPIYLLWRNVFSSSLLIFDQVVFVSVLVESLKLSVYSGL